MNPIAGSYFRQARIVAVASVMMWLSIITTGRSTTEPVKNSSIPRASDSIENLDEVLRKWGEEYAGYILTEQERKEYKELISDEDRLRFIEKFWERRDPSPGTPENEFRTEYQNRFIAATAKFTVGKAGWSTDRGKIYIVFGPPSSITRAPTGAGSGSVPTEVWTYIGLPNVKLKASFDIVFADFTGAGEYEIVSGLTDNIQFYTKDGYLISGLDNYARLRADGDYANSDLSGGTSSANESRLMSEQLELLNLLQEIGEAPQRSIAADDPSVDMFYSFKPFPFHFQTAFFAGDESATTLLLLMELEPIHMEHRVDPGDPKKLQCEFHALISIARASDNFKVEEIDEVHSFTISPEALAEKRVGSYIYDTAISLAPGEYTVRYLVIDSVSHAVGSKIDTISAPDFTNPGLKGSTPVMIRRLISDASDPSAKSALQCDGATLVPAVEGYLDSTECYVYWVIYGLQETQGSKLRLLCQAHHLNELRTLALVSIIPAERSAVSILQKLDVSSLLPGAHRLSFTLYRGDQLTTPLTKADSTIILPSK